VFPPLRDGRNRYNVVSEAYVQGIMDGETFDGVDLEDPASFGWY